MFLDGLPLLLHPLLRAVGLEPLPCLQPDDVLVDHEIVLLLRLAVHVGIERTEELVPGHLQIHVQVLVVGQEVHPALLRVGAHCLTPTRTGIGADIAGEGAVAVPRARAVIVNGLLALLLEAPGPDLEGLAVAGDPVVAHVDVPPPGAPRLVPLGWPQDLSTLEGDADVIGLVDDVVLDQHVLGVDPQFHTVAVAGGAVDVAASDVTDAVVEDLDAVGIDDLHAMSAGADEVEPFNGHARAGLHDAAVDGDPKVADLRGVVLPIDGEGLLLHVGVEVPFLKGCARYGT